VVEISVLGKTKPWLNPELKVALQERERERERCLGGERCGQC